VVAGEGAAAPRGDVAVLRRRRADRGGGDAPRLGDHGMQTSMLALACAALLFDVVVLPSISPLRRLAEALSAFVMALGTFALAVLGSEAGPMVARCALGSAFLATASTLTLVTIRYLVLRGLNVVTVAPHGELRDAVADVDLAELLLAPSVVPGEWALPPSVAAPGASYSDIDALLIDGPPPEVSFHPGREGASGFQADGDLFNLQAELDALVIANPAPPPSDPQQFLPSASQVC